MPNYCKNMLNVYFEEEENAVRFLDFIKSEKQVFDFNKIIKYPEEYQKIDDARNSIDADIALIQKNGKVPLNQLKAIYEKHGMVLWQSDGYNSGGYEWCVNNWGTKWNAINPKIKTDSYGNIRLDFYTAWTPPKQIIYKLAEMFPEAEINFEYYERGKEFCGSMRLEHGKIIDVAESKYYGVMGG